jgi:uncharacterized protein YecE (DUF72 family)
VARLYCGTSGFAYPSWKPDFYPEKLPQKKFLSHYATKLNAVEINYTFHRLPSASTIEGWLAETPPSFVFVLKAHQRLTHFSRLKRSDFTRVFFEAIDVLRVQKRLGPILFQAPPNLPCDLALLADFLEDVPADARCAFEFRHKSWFTDEVYDFLEARRIALCLAESEKLVVPERVTADWIYFRLRKGDYPPEERAAIAGKATQLLAEGKDVYVFFKHEDTPAGALYAMDLLDLQKDSARGLSG